MTSNLGEILKNISESDNDTTRKELLESLRTALGNLTRNQLSEAVAGLPLEILFDYLGNASLDETDTICGILREIMMVSDPLTNIQQYHEPIMLGFQHPAEVVRDLVMAQLLRCLEGNDEVVGRLCSSENDLVVAAIRQIANEDLGVAKNASTIIVKLASREPGFKYLFSANGFAPLRDALTDGGASDAVKFRVYEALAKIASLSEQHFNEIQKNSLLLEPLCKLAFECSDPLEQLNALEILSIVAETKYGSDALIALGAYDHMKTLNETWKTDKFGHVIFPGILKFVGRIGSQRLPPPDLINILFTTLGENKQDIPLETVALEALAYVGSTAEGKQYLDKQPKIKECFLVARKILEDSAAEFKCRILEALAHLFGSDESQTPCLPKWFNIVFPQISMLFDLVQQPFSDIRLSALNFLASIAHLEWAQKHYLRNPGVIEFLTDRTGEPSKECVLAKYKIVSIIVDSATDTTKKILTPENLATLRMHQHQGAFYAAPMSAVAMEGV